MGIHNSDHLKNYLSVPNSLISFMENSEDFWFIKDKQSRYLYQNPATLNYFNIPRNFDTEGRFDHEIPTEPHQEFWKKFVDHDQRVIQENKKISSLEIHYYAKNTPISFICEKSPLYDDNNQCVGIICRAIELDVSSFFYYMTRNNRATLEIGTPKDIFTPRENEIAFLLLQQRLTSKEIARRLSISYRTVENRIQMMYHKAGVNTLRQFIEYCQARGFDRYVPDNFIHKGVELII